MITKNFDIVLDIKQDKNLLEMARVTQGDNATNIFDITIRDGAREIDYSRAAVGRIVFSKPDKTTVQGTLTKTDAGYSYTLGTNEIAAPGEVLVAVSLYGAEDERLTTARFKMRVDRDLLGDDVIESTTQFDALTQMINDLREQIESGVVTISALIRGYTVVDFPQPGSKYYFYLATTENDGAGALYWWDELVMEYRLLSAAGSQPPDPAPGPFLLQKNGHRILQANGFGILIQGG